MNIVEISSLPKTQFAHIYKAPSFRNHFSVAGNFIEISYISEGSLQVEVGTEKFVAEKGDVLCLFHTAETSVAADSFHCHHTVGISVDWNFSEDEQGGLLLPVITPAETNTANACHIIDSIIHRHILYKTSTAKGAAKLLELFCEIDECNRKFQNQNLPSGLSYVQRAKNYVHQNIHENITQNSIAGYLGISPGYLCSIFKKTEGITIMRYINELKLQSIKALIDNENVYLYEAAALYGYTDPNYVSRLFKQLFGYNITDAPYIHPET